MYTIFQNELDLVNTGIINFRDMDYIKKSYTRAFDNIRAYFINKDFYLPNNDIIHMILKKYLDVIDLSDEALYDYVQNIAMAKIRSIGIGSMYVSPVFFKDRMFMNSNELYYADFDEPLNLNIIKRKWNKMKSVKVLYTTLNGLYFTHPVFYRNNETHNFIFKINIPLLILQLKQYKIYCNYNDIDFKLSNFINNYIYVNMLPSLIDNCILNTYTQNIDTLEFKNDFKFAISDYTDKLNRVYDDCIKYFKNEKFKYEKTVQCFPMLFHKNVWSLLKLDNLFFTKQSMWIMLLARSEHTLWLLELLDHYGIQANTSLVNKIRIELRRLKSMNNLLPATVPKNIQSKCYTTIDNISKLV